MSLLLLFAGASSGGVSISAFGRPPSIVAVTQAASSSALIADHAPTITAAGDGAPGTVAAGDGAPSNTATGDGGPRITDAH